MNPEKYEVGSCGSTVEDVKLRPRSETVACDIITWSTLPFHDPLRSTLFKIPIYDYTSGNIMWTLTRDNIVFTCQSNDQWNLAGCNMSGTILVHVSCEITGFDEGLVDNL